ncbi:hypothetical protein GQ457_18G014960 [Hibiscus cannabinus]
MPGASSVDPEAEDKKVSSFGSLGRLASEESDGVTLLFSSSGLFSGATRHVDRGIFWFHILKLLFISSSTGRNSERDESSGDNIVGNGNDINSNDLGNINLSTDNQAPRDLDRQIGIMELQGSKTITRWADIVVKDCGAPTNQRMVNEPNTEHNNTVSGDKNPTDKIVDNEATIGLTSESLEPVSPEGIRHSFSPNWANSIDLINNKNSSARSKEERTQSHNEIESVSEAEEELQNLNKIDRLLKRRRDKKYGSMKEIQDRILNEADRKKRDRALRRIRKKEKNLNLEIGEASLSSSDLRKRRDILFRDAVKTLEFGKKVGFEAEGDSMQVIRDMRYISLIGKWQTIDIEAEMINVYAPNDVAEQVILWEDLKERKIQN